jgi:hypothetical protein
MLSKFSRSRPCNSREGLVAPDPRPHITGSGSERAARWAGCHRDDRVLVALQHELRVAGSRIPELYPAVLGSGEDPVSIWGEGNREDEVLTPLSVLKTHYQNRKLTLCPSKVLMHRPPLGAVLGCPPLGATSSHILIVLSKLPETRSFPFGAKATE